MNNLGLKFQPTLVAISVALAMSSVSAEEVKTKETKADETEVITVTGIRGSLSEALNNKRFSDQIVDSISAEDVGKFPDDNIAEALQRIAGVSMSRDETGSGDVVSIRGMGPDMNKVTMNGQAVASAGGVGNTGQGFSFGVLSADMISALEVWKSPKASQDAGSVGGTVNIKTKSPLEVEETKIHLGLEAGFQEVGEENSHKVTARIISQFFDNKVGLSFGFNQSASPYRTDSAGVNSYVKPKNPSNMVDESGAAYDGSNWGDGWDDGKPWMINGYKLQQRTANRDKNGADFTLQWRPTDALDIRLNGLYAEQIDDDHQENLLFKFNAGGRKGREGVVDENGFVSEVAVTPKNGNQRDLQLQTWLRTHEKDTKAVNFNVDWTVTDNSSLLFAAGTSEGNRWMGQQFPVFLASGVLSYNQNTSSSTRFPDLAVNGEVAMPEDNAFLLTSVANQIKQWEETNDYIQLDYELDTGFETFHQISVGVKSIETHNSQQVQKGKISGNLGTMEDFYSHTTPSTAYYQGTPWNSWSTASFAAIEEVWGDIDDIELGLNTNVDVPSKTKAEGSPIEDWQVDNDITALYIQADFDAEFIWPVRGNIGVRYEETELTAHAMTQVGNDYTPFTATNDYSDFLPSLNMVFEVRENFLMRFSAAKVMARPIARDLAPAYRLNSNGELNGSGGNPYLDPFRANQLDLGVEWYFDEGSLLSANYFKKDVESFIAKEVTKQPLNGEIYDISSPVNGGAADIQGLELGYQQHFTGLPGFLSDMGTQINYTYTDSSTEFVNTAFEREMPMEGLSENTINATLYYEVESFSARVAYTYRDEYLYSGAGWSVNPIFLKASTYVDAQLNYKLNKTFSFAFKANNLTDQEIEQYLFEEQYPISTSQPGRNYKLSMTVRL